MSKLNHNITDVPGIKVGHEQDDKHLTGCTAIIIEEGAVCGIDVRGSAPGTINSDMLNPLNSVQEVYGISLSGGSAFGLETTFGIMQYLEEKEKGISFGGMTVPTVPGAIIFDLVVGDGSIRPDKKMGYRAAKNAKKGSFVLGNVGAGIGATVGKLAGIHRAMKGGLGSASIKLENGLIVGAIVVVNAVGEVRDPQTGNILAGIRDDDNRINAAVEWMKSQSITIDAEPGMNTTIGVVASNAILTKSEATKVAAMAHNGLARTIFPVHTSFDGDTIFSLATGEIKTSLDLIGELSAMVMAEAVISAIMSAESIDRFPAAKDLKK